MRILKSGSFDNLFKLAFPVEIKPEEAAALRQEGIWPVTDPEIAEPNVMPNVKDRKRDIKALVGQLTLPRITYPTAKHMIDIDGRQYYLVSVSEPQPKKNPTGTIYLMDMQTGSPVRLPFLQYADRMRSLKIEQIRASAEQVNAKIAKWNERIDTIQQAKSPTTWPLQLVWARDVVDERIAELSRMEEALSAQLDASTTFSPAYSEMLNRMKGDLAAGRITSPADVIDTIMFIHNEDPDAIPTLLESPGITEDIKTKVRSLLGMQAEGAASEREEAAGEAAAKQERIETPTDYSVLQPGRQPLPELQQETEEEMAKKGRLPKPQQYFAPQGRTKQLRAELIGVRRNKSELAAIRGALDSLRGFIGSLASGERAKEVLTSTERGGEIKRRVAEFLHTAAAFMRGYKSDVFVRDEATDTYYVNPKLFGTTGGKGNSEVAVVVNQILSIVSSSLRAYAGEPAPDMTAETARQFSYLPQDTP